MESSSIVSFNNDSTFQNTIIKPEFSHVRVHELALHAMRDRCLLLQKRINTLETENMRLKFDITKTTECNPCTPLQEDERHKLLQKIADISNQKSKLLHHVFMVSCENKTLWTKLSNIKKIDRNKVDISKQPLIRTNTYIQSTPKSSSNYQEKFSESSLEEISLKLINSYIQEKSQLVEQYEQMTQLQEMNEDTLNVDSIEFGYLEEAPTDSLKEIRIQTENLLNLKKELDSQEQQLKLILSRMEIIMKDGYNCSSCALNKIKTVVSENKEIETSDSLANWATPTDSTNFSEPNISVYKKDNVEDKIVQVSDEDSLEQICPMCGESFSADLPKEQFLSHVENHFTGEIDL